MIDSKGIIELEGMEFHSFHGVLEREKLTGNLFVVDFKGELDMRAAAESDALEDALNYAEIYDGDPSHRPHGCISSAISVAEIVRGKSILNRIKK